MTKVIKEIKLGQHTLVIETGEIARQADGAVFVKMGGTQLLVTVVVNKKKGPSQDFFPLTVHYQERSYAGGRIPGSFNRREGRPSEIETLISRLIDRPIRPLFPEGFCQEVQVVATLLSIDPAVQPDIPAIIGTSAALMISGAPFQGPISAVRVGYENGTYTLNPSFKEVETSLLDLVVAGTKDAILMVESEAKELSEDVMLGAVMYGHEMMKSTIQMIESFAAEVNRAPLVWEAPAEPEGLFEKIQKLSESALKEAYLIKDKRARHERISGIREDVLAQLTTDGADEGLLKHANNLLDTLEKQIVRARILQGEPRIDGRDRQTVRPIAIRTKCLERAHGSVLFTRGETQAIVVATLGNDRDAQLLDSLTGESRDRFMLHYNFPPYSVGETGMMGTPKRREIGHGRLARRSLMAVLPKTNTFPYVLRVVSEITESNGSSSMATVCGTSLALMDAGVPLKAPVAGIAMGLIKEGEQFAVLTDILGDEDHLGDMDFKVAGTKEGVTALQMDIKISGITQEIMDQALNQAKAARFHILDKMNQVLSESRTQLSEYAPRIETMKVAEDKIRTVIGKGGATIKGLIESTGVQIDIDDSGVIQLFSPNEEALREAERQIKQLVAEVEVGQTYEGTVTKIVDFGAFINLLPGKDGLLHISQICSDRSQKVETVLSEGQAITVFVAGVDKQGRVKLEWQSRPQAEIAPVVETTEPVSEAPKEAADDIETEGNNS